MITAALSIGSDGGAGLLFFGLLLLLIAACCVGFGAADKNDGVVITGIGLGVVAAVLIVFGGIGIGQGDKTLPDFSKRCRGKVELSVFKTERREDDVKAVGEAVEDDLGCKDSVEAVVQIPFESPNYEEAQLEPSPMELVPVSPEKPEAGNEPSVENGGVAVPTP
jgi:hypothetical protein